MCKRDVDIGRTCGRVQRTEQADTIGQRGEEEAVVASHNADCRNWHNDCVHCDHCDEAAVVVDGQPLLLVVAPYSIDGHRVVEDHSEEEAQCKFHYQEAVAHVDGHGIPIHWDEDEGGCEPALALDDDNYVVVAAANPHVRNSWCAVGTPY